MANKTLAQLYAEHSGKVSDKWSIYLAEYDRIFAPFRDRPIRLLEIGIQNGGSLEIWSKYFVNAQKLVGCDINSACARLTYEDQRIAVVVGDANNDLTRATVLGHSSAFDIVIDDGSHYSSDIVKSFAKYFPYLEDGGIFIAEDLHCAYWQEFEGGLFDPFSSIAFFKHLADITNFEHWGIQKKRSDILDGFFTKYGFGVDEETLACIHSVEFINSICVIRKRKTEQNQLGRRVIAGSKEVVVPGIWELNASFGASLDQSRNDWATRSMPPGEELMIRVNELAKLNADITCLNQSVAERDEQIAALYDSIAALYDSTSWRIMAPMRFVGRQIKRARRAAELISPAIKRGGGFKNTTKKAIQLYRSEGFSGIKRGFRNVARGGDDRNDFAKWIRHYGTLTDTDRIAMRARIDTFSAKPLISVVMPVYNPKPEWLTEAIDSVRKQVYSHWELCIADDASTDKDIRPILERYAKEDSRIKVVFRAKNGHISAASNSALALASGEWVVLLDHDDLLSEHALFRVAESIQEDQPDLMYSDEVLISENGECVIDFACRPAFSMELLRSHPYIVHLVALRTSLVRQLGGFDETLSISQDYDLFLRVAEKAKIIVHIPEILYRWRQSENSAGHAKQNGVMEISSQILAAHLVRSKEVGWVTPGKGFNFFEVRYPLSEDLRVAIIIPTKNMGELVKQCIESIGATVHGVAYDIVVVDHESTENISLAYFAELAKHHRILRYVGPFNFSAINNWAVSQLEGKYSHYLFCNNDIEAVEKGWLERMLELGQKTDIGIVGASLFYPDGHTYQHAGVCVGMYGVAEHFGKFMNKYLAHGGLHPGYLGSLITNHELSAVTAACMLVSREAFASIQGYDEKLAIGFGDVDLCLRVRQAGYRVLQCPHAVLKHHESFTRGKSAGSDPHPQDTAFFLNRWHEFIEAGDPYYNPNLSIHSTCWKRANPKGFSPKVKRRVFSPVNRIKVLS